MTHPRHLLLSLLRHLLARPPLTRLHLFCTACFGCLTTCALWKHKTVDSKVDRMPAIHNQRHVSSSITSVINPGSWMVAKLVDGSPEGEARVCLGEAIQQIAKPSPIMITTLGPAAGLPPGGTLCCRGSVIDLIPYTLRSGRDICVSSLRWDVSKPLLRRRRRHLQCMPSRVDAIASAECSLCSALSAAWPSLTSCSALLIIAQPNLVAYSLFQWTSSWPCSARLRRFSAVCSSVGRRAG
jgi:hypothetical protein